MKWFGYLGNDDLRVVSIVVCINLLHCERHYFVWSELQYVYRNLGAWELAFRDHLLFVGNKVVFLS